MHLDEGNGCMQGELRGLEAKQGNSIPLLALVATLLAVGVYAIQWPVFLTEAFPGNDAAMYALGGWLIAEGGAPYRDFLDNKPPLIYLLNSVAFASRESPLWVLWALNVSALAFALLAVGMVARIQTGTGAITAGLPLLCVSLLPVLEGGNLTESYALPLQAAILLAVVPNKGDQNWLLRGVAVGIAVSGCFWLRPNLIGAGAAGWLALTVCAPRWRDKLAVSSGFAAAVLGCTMVAYWLLKRAGVYPDFLESVFGFNRAYSDTSWAMRLLALITGAASAFGAVGVFVAAGLAKLLLQVASQNPLRSVAIFVIAWASLELPLAVVSGFRFPHYFVPVVFAFSLPLILGFDWITMLLREALARAGALRLRRATVPLVTCLGLLGAGLPEVKREVKAVLSEQSHERQERSVADYLRQHSRPTDYVLIWGYAPGPYVLSNRKPASRHVHANFLTLGGYVDDPTMTLGFLWDLQRTRPVLIIDALVGTAASLSLVRPTPGAASRLVREPPSMWELRRWIDTHYEEGGRIGPWQWPTYRPRPGAFVSR